MKRNAVTIFGLLFLLINAGGGMAKTVGSFNQTAAVKFAKVTLEQARKIALKKVEGTVEDEYTFEDDEGEVTTYVFVIKDKKGKSFEVQIDADKGDVVSSEELEGDEDEDEDPPVNFFLR